MRNENILSAFLFTLPVRQLFFWLRLSFFYLPTFLLSFPLQLSLLHFFFPLPSVPLWLWRFFPAIFASFPWNHRIRICTFSPTCFFYFFSLMFVWRKPPSTTSPERIRLLFPHLRAFTTKRCSLPLTFFYASVTSLCFLQLLSFTFLGSYWELQEQINKLVVSLGFSSLGMVWLFLFSV